ncbi:hypothetical protein TRFO_30584 [Tritrichomonas foetus]|uniref:Uncharacterized protein n=1 Tax=Tritrichomonas foetus TaxID=1144522 RepID=A0A1J4JXZ5_9EUKA|nr:hypothetical protein TRFO_30584 [Tritrichomonas foetus]|eukprot:OHT02382.1 hypothetical protein TRFO_30584 [Tritrichomonas foetus]
MDKFELSRPEICLDRIVLSVNTKNIINSELKHKSIKNPNSHFHSEEKKHDPDGRTIEKITLKRDRERYEKLLDIKKDELDQLTQELDSIQKENEEYLQKREESLIEEKELNETILTKMRTNEDFVKTNFNKLCYILNQHFKKLENFPQDQLLNPELMNEGTNNNYREFEKSLGRLRDILDSYLSDDDE